VWRFLVVMCLVLLGGSVTSLHASGTATKHGCAPVIPPAVSGPLTQPSTTPGFLVINEVLLTPHTAWACSNQGQFSNAWIELYNPHDQAFDLYSARTGIDSGPGTNTYFLPFGAAIAAHGFLVLFPRTVRAETFSQQASLRLLIFGSVIDQVTPPPLGEDIAYARIPDGGSAWQVTSNPTIDETNTPAPTPTPTPRHHTTGGNHTNSGNKKGKGQGSNQNTGGSTTDSTASDASQPGGTDLVQPGWHTLQLPTATPTSSFTARPPVASASPVSPTNDVGVAKKILLSLLALALALALFWCWRLFTRP